MPAACASRRPFLLSALAAATCAFAIGALPVAATAATKSPAASGATSAAAAASPVKVEGAWIRQTVQGQTATGGFMTLRASRDLTLVGFSADVADDAELHEMVMDGSVMRMRAVERLALPAGKAVALKPGAGAHHLMLMGLKQPLAAGTEVRIELHLEDAKGAHLQQTVTVPVRAGHGAAGMGMHGGEPGMQPKVKGGGAHHHHH